MSRHAEAPVLKVTMNFYKSDIEFIRDRFGEGWSIVVRDFIKEKVKQIKEEDRG